MEERLARWRLRGRVFLWRYGGGPRMCRGWHLSADAVACRSLGEACDWMQSSTYPSRIDMVITAVEDRPSPPRFPETCRARPVSHLRLLHDPGAPTDQWQLESSDDAVTLTMGCAWLARFRQGLSDIAAGKDDYAIGEGEDDALLWFWRR